MIAEKTADLYLPLSVQIFFLSVQKGKVVPAAILYDKL